MITESILKITGEPDLIEIFGESIAGTSKLYYQADGELKYGSVTDSLADFNSGQEIKVLTVKPIRSFNTDIFYKQPSLINGYSCWEKAKVVYHGIKKVFRLELSNGKWLDLTEDHSVFSAGDCPHCCITAKKLFDLTNVISVENYPIIGKPLKEDEDTITLFGLWLADGCYDTSWNKKDYGVIISAGNDKKIIAFLENYCKKKNYNLKKKGEHGDYRIYEQSLARKIKRFFGKVDCYTKIVPKEIMTATDIQIACFLKGYFSGDGSIHYNSNTVKNTVRIDASSVSKELIDSIAVLLNRLGIKNTVGLGYMSHGIIPSTKPIYKLNIERRNSLKTFILDVGLIKDIKQDFLDCIDKQPEKEKIFHNLSRVSVRSITPLGEVEVFDYSVPGTESFIANGILCHNSGTSKSTFCVELAKEAIKAGKKVKYIDTEKNLKGKLEGADYEYNPDFAKIFEIVQNLKPGYELVILDSLGLPILGEFATVSMKEKGNFLLKAQAISYMLKKYACNNKCFIIVTNQPESEFNKDRDHVLRPFGDKSMYFYKEVWKTENIISMPETTTCVVNAFRSRNYGRGYRLFNVNIGKNGTTITETAR